MMGEKYSSVVEMLEASGANRQMVQAAKQRISSTQVMRLLLVGRATKGLTQAELAERMGVSRAVIQRFEQLEDDSMRLGMVEKYVAGLGMKLKITLENEDE